MSVFVHTQGIKTCGGGGQKWQNSVHVVVECLLSNMTFAMPGHNRFKAFLMLHFANS
jgi:hypothetical protein